LRRKKSKLAKIELKKGTGGYLLNKELHGEDWRSCRASPSSPLMELSSRSGLGQAAERVQVRSINPHERHMSRDVAIMTKAAPAVHTAFPRRSG